MIWFRTALAYLTSFFRATPPIEFLLAAEDAITLIQQFKQHPEWVDRADAVLDRLIPLVQKYSGTPAVTPPLVPTI